MKAAQLAAAFELGRRAAEAWPNGRWTVRAPRDVADRMMVEMGVLDREELRVILWRTAVQSQANDRAYGAIRQWAQRHGV